MEIPKEKYFVLLHTSKQTNYSDNRTLLLSEAGEVFEASKYSDVESKISVGEIGMYAGYLGYGLKNSLEELPSDEDFFIKTPNAWFAKFENVKVEEDIVFDSKEYVAPEILYLKSNMTKIEYLEKVRKIKSYIENGDIYQANLTRKFYGKFETVNGKVVDAFEIYKKLNEVSPAPYSAFLKIDDLYIISSSPELFIRLESDGINAVTSPIKGSIKAGEGKKLARSNKDMAENLMITDLMRNDFARSCEFGTVEVEDLFKVNNFETISHMVSTVKGRLKVGEDSLSLIKNCFPPGSMTGAPKIRAMEICTELEKHERGIYSGSIGYFNKNNDNLPKAEFSVVIRTLIIKGNKFEFQVGGGIVYDSDPEKEWQETLTKAKAIANVLGVENEIREL